MTDPGITLNIYNKPPQIEGNPNDNNNPNETRSNLNDENQSNNYDENIRMDSTSAPRANNGLQTIDNTRNESIETTGYNQSSLPPIPQQYQAPPMYQRPPVQPVLVTPVRPQIIQPYNIPQYPQYAYNPYSQPVIIQQQTPQQRQQVQTIYVNKKKKKDDDDTAKNCCGGLFAGCCATLAACCLLSLCLGAAGG